MTNIKKHLILVDGYNFVFRAYYSLPPLTRSDNVEVGAVYGYLNMLYKLVIEMDYDAIAVAFDSGKKNFRHLMYEEYKTNRDEAPESLIPQFALTREATRALNIAILEKAGFEADDLIATYTKKAEAEDYRVTIVSSDKDLMQLINDNVQLFDTLQNKTIGKEEVFKKYQVYPEQLLDTLSLIGDKVDNIPGVPSIGPKTAASLIQQFNNLENILNNTSAIVQNKKREALEQYKEQALLSKKLITLDENVKLDISVKDLLNKEILASLFVDFLLKNNFKSMVARFAKTLDNAQKEIIDTQVKEYYIQDDSQFHSKNKRELVHIKTNIELENFVHKLRDIQEISLFISAYEHNEKKGYIIAIATNNHTYLITYELSVDLKNEQKTQDLFSQKSMNKEVQEVNLCSSNDISKISISKFLKDLLASKAIKKVNYDTKNLIKLIQKICI